MTKSLPQELKVRWVNPQQTSSVLSLKADTLLLLLLYFLLGLIFTPHYIFISSSSVILALFIYLICERTRLEWTLEHLHVSWRIPEQVIRGENAEIKVIIKNPTKVNLKHINISICLPQKKLKEIKGSLSQLHQLELCFSIPCFHLSAGHIWGIECEVKDALGLVSAERVICEFNKIRILPRSVFKKTVHRPHTQIQDFQQHPQISARPKKSQDGEFAELRDYQPYDSHRKIAWRASARQGKLLTKVDESYQEPRYLLAIDLNPLIYQPLFNETRASLAIDQAHEELLRLKGEQVGLIIFDHQAIMQFPVAKQKITYQRFKEIDTYLAQPFLPINTAITIDELWSALSNYLIWAGGRPPPPHKRWEYEPHFSQSLRLKNSLSIDLMSNWLSNYYTDSIKHFADGLWDQKEYQLRRFCYEIGIISAPKLPRSSTQLHQGLSEVFHYAHRQKINHIKILSHSQRLQSVADISLLKQWSTNRYGLEWIQIGSSNTKLPEKLSSLSNQIAYSPILIEGASS